MILLFVPLIKIYFYARCLCGKDKIVSVRNHFGVPTIKRPKGKVIWIHAASIGESSAALTYIAHIKKQFPDVNVLLTTITVTSAEVLAPKIAKIKGCFHQFAVADNPFWIEKFLNYWQPRVSFFLESEIWPNTIDALHKRKIQFFLLNARLSPRSLKKWKRAKRFFTSILEKFTAILAQSDIDFQRFTSFSPKNTKRMDNLKYANDPLPCNNDLLKIFQKICVGKKVFVAVSTHEKEEEIIQEAHKKLKANFDMVTIIIPRHLTRVKKICEIFQKHNVTFSLRSENPIKNSEVFCVDTFGEIGTFIRLADLCFVGGSLIPVGGHNIYEPVALGKPVLHGPFMANALAVRDFLHQKQVAFEVKNAADISEICTNLFSDSAKLKSICQRARKISTNKALQQIDNVVQLSKILRSTCSSRFGKS
ncbi:MAG: 3-deoxy-D-manno-octulosonic acid transferase [Holosporaceae bacterium]|nr:3-deoxy-D-manno-octulosonic acid transferase [Holosporaceae bacterium]